MTEFSQEPDQSRTPPSLPVVTSETIQGLVGTLGEHARFFRDADDIFYDQQTELYVAITEWARLQYGPEGVDIAKRTAAILYFALTEQAASDDLKRQHPEV